MSKFNQLALRAFPAGVGLMTSLMVTAVAADPLASGIAASEQGKGNAAAINGASVQSSSQNTHYNAMLLGRVVNASGQAIADAKVTLLDQQTLLPVNDKGEFTLPSANIDELHVAAPGYSHKVVHLHGELAEDNESVKEQSDEETTTSDQPFIIKLQPSAIETIDVVGLPLHTSTMESTMAVSVLAGDDLRNKQADTLGETLKAELGVHSTYYGGVASSPIIRGLDGPRVMITQNGLDAGDVSRVGPDHVVSSDSASTLQIEVLRGPATLFYGSGAIGGVVNIVDDRVPTGNENTGEVGYAFQSVDQQKHVSGAYTGGSEQVKFHIDGYHRTQQDYRLPVDFSDESELHGTSAESKGINLGTSLMLDNGFVGVSYGFIDRYNGIPGHGDHGEAHEEAHHDEAHALDGAEHGHDAHEEEQIFSDMQQERVQLLAETKFNSNWLQQVNTKVGITSYRHEELHEEDHGVEEALSGANLAHEEEGTVFKRNALQVKTDWLHHELSGWRGALSVEYKATDLQAEGEEAFTSPSKTSSFALALIEERHQGDWLWQLGARVEQLQLRVDPVSLPYDEHSGGAAEVANVPTFKDAPISAAMGGVWDMHPDYKLAIGVSYGERGATAGEAVALGPHIGTGSYEIGALFEVHEHPAEAGETESHWEVEMASLPELERSTNFDISLRKHQGRVGFVLNGFVNNVQNYFYSEALAITTHELFGHEEPTGAEPEAHGADLPVYQFQQANVLLYGYEGQVEVKLNPRHSVELWSDYIRAEFQQGGNLPRIPPLRFGAEWKWKTDRWQSSLSWARNEAQNRIATNETSTKGYSMVEGTVSYRWFTQQGDVTLYSKLSNALDQVARVHSSYLKEQAPLPGRSIQIGIRGQF